MKMPTAMKAVTLATVSVFAIALGSSGALAQTSNSSGANSNSGVTTSAAGQKMGQSDLKSKLEKAGVDDREEFKGHLVVAQAPSGQSVQLLFGPEDFEGGKSADKFDQDRVRSKLTKAGFSNIQFGSAASMVRGQMSDDKQILAFSSDVSPAFNVAQSDSPATSDLKKDMKNVDLGDRSEFKGKLVTARTDQGTVRILIGPKEFEGGKSVELSAGDLDKLQQNGFSDAQVTRDVTMVKGEMDDMQIIALSGQGLSSTTGSAR
ncbi:hypothetical protein SR870_14830 [Rhodopseudomonas palustris]|uniref:hypothetical protein n=1 Tax=Rhodopseudomonas palustris TaxID=1076 RepID=UPI002ACD9A0C|nr:hypothetical protein [Rhodopseudomonas palustris]WQG97974.1 hypothetical protein SR870_14830 [Rhodopseudomonas palustris]